MAAELTEILSAPSLNNTLKSSILRIPPPTVNGINTRSATFLTKSTVVFLPSLDAVISRNTSSSAPDLSYMDATSTGSPASLKSTKFVPFTTLPFLQSRHGIILFVNIANLHPFYFYSSEKFFKI